MSKLTFGYPPEPLNPYRQHDRYDWYYKRDDKGSKRGQPWDLFTAWGQQRLLVDRKEGKVKANSCRLPMTYKATSCTLPSLPPNNLIADDFLDPCLQPVKEQEELSKMKETLLHRISLVKDSRRSYGNEVATIGKVARNLLRRVRKHVQVSPVDFSSSEEEIDDENSLASFNVSKRSKDNSDLSSDSDDSDVGAVGADELAKTVTTFCRDHEMVNRVLCGLQNDSRCFEEVRVPVIPTHYLGGCLSSTHIDGDHHLAHSTGAHLSSITVKQVKRVGECTHMTQLCCYDNEETVRQVTMETYGCEMMFCCRSRSKTSVCQVQGETVSSLDIIEKPDVQHVSLNPHFPEAVFVHSNNVYRWTDNSHCELLFSDWSTRFPVSNDTKSVHYGCHPRQLVMTDPSVCTLYDTRSRSSVDLFEIPSNTLLQSEERLITSAPAGGFLHHILSHHTLLSVDERFTKYPVLYQVLPCLTWPMHLESSSHVNNTRVLAIGCPTNHEVFAMVTDDSQSVTKTTPIWQCSRPSDVCFFSNTQPPTTDRNQLNQRLNAGLLGLTVSSWQDDSFTVHMLSGKGDLFEQTYVSAEADMTDRTMAAGPLLNSVKMPSEAANRCRLWYDSLSGLSDVVMEEKTIPILSVPKNGQLMSRQDCCVCKGAPSDDIGEEFECLACGLSTSMSRQLCDSLKIGRYFDYGIEEHVEAPNLAAFDPVAKAGSDANSNLLLKLWNEEDINEVLEERDKEWDARRNAANRQAGEVDDKSTLDSSEFNALSSITATTRPSKAKSKASRRSAESKDLSKLPGFNSPKPRSQAGSDVGSTAGSDILISTRPGSLLWMSNALTPGRGSAKKKGKTKQRKGF